MSVYDDVFTSDTILAGRIAGGAIIMAEEDPENHMSPYIRKMAEAFMAVLQTYRIDPEVFWEADQIGVVRHPLPPEKTVKGIDL